MARYRYKKSYRIKRNKSVFKKRFFWQSASVILLLFGIFYFLAFSSVFQIKAIKIEGAQKVSQEEIMLKIENTLPRSILLFQTKSIFLANINQTKEALLQSFPQIAQIIFDRKFPAVLNVEIKEREGRAIWCSDECYLIDQDGVAFKAEADNDQLMRIQVKAAAEQVKLGQSVIATELLASIFKIEAFLKERAGLETEKATVVSNERVNFKIREGWEIYFNLEEDIEWQVTKLILVLEKEITPEKREAIEYIDLRFTSVYYK